MANAKIAVTGIYPTQGSLESGALALRKVGFRAPDISVLYPESPGIPGRELSQATNAPEGRAAGGVAGTPGTGLLGWLPGIGAITIPGIGVFIAAGPIVSALTDAVASLAVDGLAAGLLALGLTASDAGDFRDRVLHGETLISVRSDNGYWAGRARGVMERTGARNISITGEDNRNFGMSGQHISCLAQE